MWKFENLNWDWLVKISKGTEKFIGLGDYGSISNAIATIRNGFDWKGESKAEAGGFK